MGQSREIWNREKREWGDRDRAERYGTEEGENRETGTEQRKS